jgi:hypothetical protein
LLGSRRLVQTDQRTSGHSEKLPSFHPPPDPSRFWLDDTTSTLTAYRFEHQKGLKMRAFANIPHLNGCRVDAPALPIET